MDSSERQISVSADGREKGECVDVGLGKCDGVDMGASNGLGMGPVGVEGKFRSAKNVIPDYQSKVIHLDSPSSLNPSRPISSPPLQSILHALLTFSADPTYSDTASDLATGVPSLGLIGLGRVGKRHARVKEPLAAVGNAGLANGFERDGEGSGSEIDFMGGGRGVAVDIIPEARGRGMKMRLNQSCDIVILTFSSLRVKPSFFSIGIAVFCLIWLITLCLSQWDDD